MAALRAVAAIALVSLGWWFGIELPERFELGTWYVFVAIVLMALGPALAGFVVSAPRFRMTDMKGPTIAAALTSPALVFVIAFASGSSPEAPVWLFMLPPLVVGAMSAMLSWAFLEMVEASRGREG